MTDVFISYSRKDKDFVRHLHNALENAGKDAWIDWENIPLTADWLEEIRDGIEAADSFIFVISADSVHSEVCAEELNYALKNRKRLIPIMHRELIEDYDRAALHPTISSHNWLFFRETDDFDQAFATLLNALDADLNHSRSHTRLLVKAKEWSDRNRDLSLLLRGNDLREAEEWLTQAMGKTPEPTELHTEYIMTSHNASNQRQRTTLLWMSGALVAMIGLLVLAGYMWVQANNARQLAVEAQQIAEREAEISGSLAIASSAQQTSDRILALALAEAATRIDQPPGQVSRALADVVYAPGVRARLDESVADAAVTDGAVSPGGTLMVLGDADGDVIIWDQANQTSTILQIDGAAAHTAAINRVLFSSSGRQILAASDDGTVTLWNTSSQQTTARIAIGAPVCDAAYSPDGAYLVVGTSSGEDCESTGESGTGQVYRYEIASETLTEAIIPPPASADGSASSDPDSVSAIGISLDGLRLAIGYNSGRMVMWDLTEDVVLLDLAPHSDRINSIDFSPDGRFVLTSSADETAKKLSASSLRPVLDFVGHTNVVLDATFSSDGTHVITSSEDRTLIYWNADNGNRLNRLWAHGNFVTSVAFTPDDTRALSTSADGTAMVWDLTPGNILRIFTGHESWIRAVDLWESPTDQTTSYAASGSDDNTAIIWNLNSGERLQTLNAKDGADVRAVRFLPDGRTLITASMSGFVRLWNVADGAMQTEYSLHNGEGIQALDIAADGTRAMTGGNDGFVRIWDTQTGEILLEMEQGGDILHVRFSPDGTKALATSTNRTLVYWDLTSGERLGEAASFGREPVSIAFHPDGTQAVIGTRDSEFYLWNLDSFSAERLMIGHGSTVRGSAFAPDGRTAMSASADLTMFLWDVSTGEAIRQFNGHERVVYSVVFTRDGTQALSGSRDKTLILWRVDDDERLLEWMHANRFTRDLTPAECDLYRVRCDLLPSESEATAEPASGS